MTIRGGEHAPRRGWPDRPPMTGSEVGVLGLGAISLIWTKARRIWARASFNDGSASPRRPVSPSTSAAMASTARRASSRSGRLLRQVDGGQFEQPVGVVGHDHLGRCAEQLAAQLVEPGGELRPFLGARGSRGRGRRAWRRRVGPRRARAAVATGARRRRGWARRGAAVAGRPTRCSPSGVQRLLTPGSVERSSQQGKRGPRHRRHPHPATGDGAFGFRMGSVTGRPGQRSRFRLMAPGRPGAPQRRE